MPGRADSWKPLSALTSKECCANEAAVHCEALSSLFASSDGVLHGSVSDPAYQGRSSMPTSPYEVSRLLKQDAAFRILNAGNTLSVRIVAESHDRHLKKLVGPPVRILTACEKPGLLWIKCVTGYGY